MSNDTSAAPAPAKHTLYQQKKQPMLPQILVDVKVSPATYET